MQDLVAGSFQGFSDLERK